MTIKHEVRHVIIDTETTGLNSKTCAVVEIAAIIGRIDARDKSFHEVARFEAMAKPPMKYLGEAAEPALQKTGIERKEIDKARADVLVADEFHAWLNEWCAHGRYPLVLHSYNVDFDAGMLDNDRWRIPRWTWGTCIMVTARDVMRRAGRFSGTRYPNLEMARQYAKVETPKSGRAHRAMYDTEVAAGIFDVLYQRGWI